MSKCASIKADGSTCEGVPKVGATYCYAHDPERLEERRRNAAKGGAKAGRGRPASTGGEIPAVKKAVLELVEGVLSGAVDRGAAAVAGNLYNTVLRATDLERRVRETEELERRLEALEARLLETEGVRSWGR